MFYIIEDTVVMRDAEGEKLTYVNREEALQAISYIEAENPNDDHAYRVVPMVKYALGEEV